MTIQLASGPPSHAVAVADHPGADRAAVTVMGAVCTALEQRGWRTRVVLADLCGEPEVRLLVEADSGAVHAELLGPCAAVPLSRRWHAVRVDGTERVVWRGPARSCPPDALLRFVEALLGPDPSRDAPCRVLS